MTGPSLPRDPFDPDAALIELRPRLAAARSRRRRLVTSSAMSVVLVVGALGLLTLPTPEESDELAVTAGADVLLPSTTTTSPTTSALPPDAASTATSAVPPLAPEVTDPPPLVTTVPAKTPPPPPPAPAPLPPPAPAPGPAAVQTSFTYDGTGSIVVEQRGDSLTLVSTAPQPGWVATPHHGSDYVKVEFTKGSVHRWLKVRVHDGVAVAERWEHVDAPACVPTAGTASYDAPAGAGRISVTVTAEGTLKLGQVTTGTGWTSNLYRVRDDNIKVKFRNDQSGQHVWVEVTLHDCAVKVHTG
jgi:hypothetical protein